MDAYVYRGSLICAECRNDPDNAASFDKANPFDDSEVSPQGPYADGGGESDTPQHCDTCGVFLENPLTPDGYTYVLDALIAHLRDGQGNVEVLYEWASYYWADYIGGSVYIVSAWLEWYQYTH